MKKLECVEISKSFKKRIVVNNISIRLKQGEIIGLLGPNGAGKTTTFYMILGIHKPDKGRILLNGKDMTKLPIYIRARLGISFLPQEPSVFKGLTVKENIQAILDINNHKPSTTINKILLEMGLTELKDHKAFMLSGGERRRLEIARSLVLSPDFLLLDEPFAGIDPIQIKELQTLIVSFKEKGLGIIITDHNVREILKITERSYIINKGEIIFQGDSNTLISDKKVKAEYLGKTFRWN
ncbi:MAG: LPS export ABC transporter ATP-binding protein [Candidatus Aminicenantes bacterium]|nr:LPS export ABC transporter ATP-binding protein [Candidatus Aminicenantes bacterium]